MAVSIAKEVTKYKLIVLVQQLKTFCQPISVAPVHNLMTCMPQPYIAEEYFIGAEQSIDSKCM